MHFRVSLTLLSTFAMSLAACGGGGGSASIDAAQAINLTDARAPQETVSDQLARSPNIASRSDAFTLSTIYGETTSPNLPTFTLVANCSRARCIVTEPMTGISTTISLDDPLIEESGVATVREVLTTRPENGGITLLEGRGGTAGPNYRIYGAWMTHGTFSVETRAQDITDDGVLITLRGASAIGDLTNTRPATDATWRGVMVGTPTRGTNRDNILQGNAELTYTFANEEIDAHFSNIVNLDREMPHSVTDVRFDDVPVAADGTYEAGDPGNKIQGGFVGTEHSETGGVFEQQGIVGAFGARR